VKARTDIHQTNPKKFNTSLSFSHIVCCLIGRFFADYRILLISVYSRKVVLRSLAMSIISYLFVLAVNFGVHDIRISALVISKVPQTKPNQYENLTKCKCESNAKL